MTNIGANPAPQRVAGYATLANFMAVDEVFCIFRKFEDLSIRNLLYLQDEICELEEKLQTLDQADLHCRNDVRLYSLHSRRHDQNQERKMMMQDIDKKLYNYRKSFLFDNVDVFM